ncbi:hypothetical protein K0M31_020367 [Melipona bicolor]|uniref:Uncharacterized protein n=1 Tax=Melipona bicolor TaxID=60889 RepID=A0AA40KQN9_9HYME|nr:hypothetical protein K0M31_020367 [Melipona bicolor]
MPGQRKLRITVNETIQGLRPERTASLCPNPEKLILFLVPSTTPRSSCSRHRLVCNKIPCEPSDGLYCPSRSPSTPPRGISGFLQGLEECSYLVSNSGGSLSTLISNYEDNCSQFDIKSKESRISWNSTLRTFIHERLPQVFELVREPSHEASVYRGRVTKLANNWPERVFSQGNFYRVKLHGSVDFCEGRLARDRATATFDAPDEIRRNRLGIIKVPWRMRRDAASALASIGNFTGRERAGLKDFHGDAALSALAEGQ